MVRCCLPGIHHSGQLTDPTKADLGSAMPTSGGLYWWTHFFASPATRNPLCFLVGYRYDRPCEIMFIKRVVLRLSSNTLGLVGGLCSIDCMFRVELVTRTGTLTFYTDGFSLMFLAVISIARDGNWQPSTGAIYGTFLGCVICHAILASTMSKIMGKLQTVFVVMNFVLIAATIIALPIGKHQANRRNDAHYIFAQTENLTTWPTGWAFMLAWLSPIWTIGAFDSCVHMSEEAANATKAVPYGILMSIASCWLFGFIIVIVLAACINQDLESVLGSPFGQPIAQVCSHVLPRGAECAVAARDSPFHRYTTMHWASAVPLA